MVFDVVYIAVGIRLVNIAMLLYLIHFYSKSYRKIKSDFTTGLMFFSVFLFLQNISAVYFRYLSGANIDVEFTTQNIVLNILQALGLASLVYITRK